MLTSEIDPQLIKTFYVWDGANTIWLKMFELRDIPFAFYDETKII